LYCLIHTEKNARKQKGKNNARKKGKNNARKQNMKKLSQQQRQEPPCKYQIYPQKLIKSRFFLGRFF
jgi:hypothetical protein